MLNLLKIRLPTNHFSEIEQLAFSPANLIPGIELSPDKMLQARVFAYADAQRYRLSKNYAQLPVNRPLNSTGNNRVEPGMKMEMIYNLNNKDYIPLSRPRHVPHSSDEILLSLSVSQ